MRVVEIDMAAIHILDPVSSQFFCPLTFSTLQLHDVEKAPGVLASSTLKGRVPFLPHLSVSNESDILRFSKCWDGRIGNWKFENFTSARRRTPPGTSRISGGSFTAVISTGRVITLSSCRENKRISFLFWPKIQHHPFSSVILTEREQRRGFLFVGSWELGTLGRAEAAQGAFFYPFKFQRSPKKN